MNVHKRSLDLETLNQRTRAPSCLGGEKMIQSSGTRDKLKMSVLACLKEANRHLQGPNCHAETATQFWD